MHTSVHGVGHAFVQSAFKAFDLDPPYAVEEQKDPDPEFPTVKYPNPEEGEGVLVCYTRNMQSIERTCCVWFEGLSMSVFYRHCRLRWQREKGPLLCWQMIQMLID